MSFETGPTPRPPSCSGAGPRARRGTCPTQIDDPVEHDRDDHLVRADGRLEDAGDPGPVALRRALASTSASRMWTTQVGRGKDEPTQTPAIAPTMYWPWPPMLKRPQRKANATARPVRMSAVVSTSVLCRSNAALIARRRHPREEPVESRAFEDRPVGRERVVPGRDQHDQAADEEREERRDERGDETACALQHRRAAARRLPDPPRSGDAGPPVAHAATSSRRAAEHREAELLLGNVRRVLADDLDPRT